MKTLFASILVPSIAVCGLAAHAAAPDAVPSDPAGIYARIDRAVFLPDAEKPDRVELQGAFAIGVGGSGDYYCAPRWGRLVLTAPAGKLDECLVQWRDVASVAGTDRIVSFSSRWDQKDIVVETDPRATPKAGVMGLGWEVRKLETSNWGPAQALRMLARPIGPSGVGPAAPERVARNGTELEFVFAHAPGQDEGTRYVIAVTSELESFASAPLTPSAGNTTSWRTSVALRAGLVVRWSVQTIRDGLERTPVAEASFVTGKAADRQR